MANLLIVDDEENIVELISRFAEHEGYQFQKAGSGKEALELFKAEEFDLIILDIMMPEMDGYTVVKRIRESSSVPIILLSALGQEYDKLMGFEIGIDDYVVKPFSPRELMARVKAILARSPKQVSENRLIYGGLEIDLPAHRVWIDQNEIDLTAKEYELLVYFIQNKGIALTREQILETIWGYDYDRTDRTVDWQVKLLRNKLGAYRSSLKTIRGVGYRLDEEA